MERLRPLTSELQQVYQSLGRPPRRPGGRATQGRRAGRAPAAAATTTSSTPSSPAVRDVASRDGRRPGRRTAPRAGRRRPGGTRRSAADPAGPKTGGAGRARGRSAAELEDRWRRALADLDNLRKRYARELDRDRGPSGPGWPRQLLPVVDNLDLALEHAGADDPADRGRRAGGPRPGRRGPGRLGFPRRDETACPSTRPVTRRSPPSRPGRAARHRRAGGAAGLRRTGHASCARPRSWWHEGGLMAARRAATSTRCWASAERRAGGDPAGVPQAGPAPTTRTSTRTRAPRSASRRSPRPTPCCRTRRPGAVRRVRARLPPGPEDVDPETWRGAPGRPARRGRGCGRGRGADGLRRTGGFSGFGDGIDLDDLFGGLFGGRGRAAAGGRSPALTRKRSSRSPSRRRTGAAARSIALAAAAAPGHWTSPSRPVSPTGSASGWRARAARAAAAARRGPVSGRPDRPAPAVPAGRARRLLGPAAHPVGGRARHHGGGGHPRR